MRSSVVLMAARLRGIATLTSSRAGHARLAGGQRVGQQLGLSGHFPHARGRCGVVSFGCLVLTLVHGVGPAA